jgi:hypothetical protein
MASRRHSIKLTGYINNRPNCLILDRLRLSECKQIWTGYFNHIGRLFCRAAAPTRRESASIAAFFLAAALGGCSAWVGSLALLDPLP